MKRAAIQPWKCTEQKREFIHVYGRCRWATHDGKQLLHDPPATKLFSRFLNWSLHIESLLKNDLCCVWLVSSEAILEKILGNGWNEMNEWRKEERNELSEPFLFSRSWEHKLQLTCMGDHSTTKNMKMLHLSFSSFSTDFPAGFRSSECTIEINDTSWHTHTHIQTGETIEECEIYFNTFMLSDEVGGWQEVCGAQKTEIKKATGRRLSWWTVITDCVGKITIVFELESGTADGTSNYLVRTYISPKTANISPSYGTYHWVLPKEEVLLTE